MKRFLTIVTIALSFFWNERDCHAQELLKKTTIVNSCLTEYTFGTATEDLYVIVVVTCNFSSTGTEWQPPRGLVELSELLIVAGGGAGGKRDDNGNRGGGGGGAGGVILVKDRSKLIFDIADKEKPNLSPPLNLYVGKGGKGTIFNNQRGGNGEESRVNTTNSKFENFIVLGGGGGGSANGQGSSASNQPYEDQRRGNIGASGGGSVGGFASGPNTAIQGGEGISPKGHKGGNGRGNDEVNGGGGGGGAGGPAPEITGLANGGNGGPGIDIGPSLIPTSLPLSVPRQFGGGGGGVAGNPGGQGGTGLGGLGGGGAAVANGNGTSGAKNTGGGGGAGGSPNSNSFTGGNGGDGIIVFRYDFVSILPVEFAFLKIDANQKSRSNLMYWATTKEWEASHFEIERAVNGTSFKKVGEVMAAGWSDQLMEYSFEDKDLPLSGGNIFYRLKQVDFNGRSSYSKIISAKINGIEFTTGTWRAYPNPTTGESLKIGLLDRMAYKDEPLTFRIIHPTAITAATTVGSEEELNQILTVHASKIPKGVFVVEVQWGQKIEHIKVLKQ